MTTEASEAMSEAERETGHGPVYINVDDGWIFEGEAISFPADSPEEAGRECERLRSWWREGPVGVLPADAIRELVEAAEAVESWARSARRVLPELVAEGKVVEPAKALKLNAVWGDFARLRTALQKVRSEPE